MRVIFNQFKYIIISIVLGMLSFWLPVLMDYYDLIPINMKWHEWFMLVICFHWCNCWMIDHFFVVLLGLLLTTNENK